MSYKRLLIQKGSYPVKDTGADFGIYVSESAVYPAPKKVKNTFVQDWKDENGKERYFADEPKYEEVEITFKCVIKGNINTVNANIRRFIEYVENCYIKFYDEYKHIGRQSVCFKGYEIIDDHYNRFNEDDFITELKLTFEVDDPITDIILTK